MTVDMILSHALQGNHIPHLAFSQPEEPFQNHCHNTQMEPWQKEWLLEKAERCKIPFLDLNITSLDIRFVMRWRSGGQLRYTLLHGQKSVAYQPKQFPTNAVVLVAL